MSPRSAEELIAYLVEAAAAQPRPAPSLLGAEWQAANAVAWACEEMGVIDAQTAERWKRELGVQAERLLDMRDEDAHRLAGPAPPPAPPLSTREKAAAYLREVEEQLVMTRDVSARDHPELAQLLRGQAAGVVEGLYSVGLLYDAERLRWLARLEEAMSPTGPAPRLELAGVRAEASAAQIVAIRRAEHPDPRAQPLRRPPDAALSVLITMFAIRADWTRGYDVYALERWDDATTVCWKATLDPSGPTHLAAQPRIDLGDDLGTHYQRKGGSGGTIGASAPTMMGRLLIVPGIPPTASRLSVIVENEAIDLTLDPQP